MELLTLVACAVLLSALVLTFASGPLRDLPEGRMDVVHSMEVETPHVPWANPLSGGPMRAWLMPAVVAGRDLVELAQRLEMRYDTLTLDVSGHNSWGFGDFYGRRGRAGNYEIDFGYLTEDMTSDQAYDVMVLPGTHPWHQLPETARKTLLERVRRGAGLVLIAPSCDPEQLGALADLSPLVPLKRDEDGIAGEPWEITQPHWITNGVPFHLLPFEQMSRWPYEARGEVLIKAGDGPILAVGSCGEGRVVTLGYVNFGFSPQVANPWVVGKAYPYWEIYYSLLCRAVIWAARRDPSAQLASVAADGENVRLSAAGEAKSATVEVTLRDDRDRQEHVVTQQIDIGRASNTLDVPIPTGLTGGLHFANVILRDDTGTLDWATAVFDVARPVTIQGVTLAQDVVTLGEDVSGTVALESTESSEVSLALRFEDNHGRVLDRCVQGVRVDGSTEVSFSRTTRHGLTRRGVVVAELRQGDRLLDHGSASLFVRIPQAWEDYEIIMDRFLPEPAPGRWPVIEQRLAEMNVSVMGAISADMCEHVNFMIQADVVCPGFHPRYHQPQWRENKAAYLETGEGKYLVRDPCYTDPGYRKEFRDGLRTLVERFVRFSPISYYAYEEASLGYFSDGFDICWSPSCLAGFREWLEETYGSLEALNAEWETDYASWDDVLPLTTTEAQEKGNYAPWADHRTFMEIVWADVYREGHEIIRSIDPHATVCLSGNQDCTPHNGYDYARINHSIDQMQQYTGWNVEDFDLAFYPGMKLTGCTGYGVSGADLSLQLWGRLFHGETAGCVIFWEISCLDPDLTFCRSGRHLAREFGALRGGGIARLLSFAKRDNCGIAIHYSYPSYHGTWITDGKITPTSGNQSEAFDLFDRGRVAWTMLLESLGYQYEFIAYSQIEGGDLIERGFRVLLLPMSVAVSETEAQAIEEFVREGGTVIADLWPAVMDEHCKWRPAGRLDEVFGVAQTDIGPADFAVTEVGQRVEAASAETGWCPGHPGATRHAYGEGKAIHLGFSPAPTVARKKQKPEAEPRRYREALAQVLADIGLEPPAQVTEDGRPAETCEAFHYDAEGAEYFGVVRYRGSTEGDLDIDSSVPPVADSRTGSARGVVRMTFPRAGHVYDVRAKAYLGHRDHAEAALDVGDAKLYAVLPYTVECVEVSAPERVAPGDELRYGIRVTASDGATPGNHVAVIKVVPPDGSEVRVYGTRVPLSRGAGEGLIPLCLSDLPGTWRIIATDVVSGVSGEAQVIVVEPST